MNPRYGLLGLLARGEQYGYELKHIVDRDFAPLWQIDFAQLYRSLNYLTGQGLIRARVTPSPAGPGRKMYTITARGRVAFEKWLAEAAQDGDEFLVKGRLAQGANLPFNSFLITASDDPLLSRLAQTAQLPAHIVGSLGGLMALAQGQADIAGIHLLDVESGEYNLPFVKRLAPEEELVLVQLAVRENGLMFAPGNSKHIRGLRDLVRQEVRFINRARGTGTRLLLHTKLRAARIDPHAIADWERAAQTHKAVAAAILAGTADAGPGLRAVAAEWGLEFMSLGEERYDLLLARTTFESPRLARLLDVMHSAEFRRSGELLQGYDLSRCGRVMALIK
jgi:molybdopterin molybdotransferase/putative molybdopterin biosynthesis protein